MIFIISIIFLLKIHNLYILSSQPTQTNCAKVHGPLTQQGTKILQKNGTEFIPYGITTPGLSSTNYQDRMANDYAQIKAAATIWCSNTIRLQVGQDNLVGANGTFFYQNFMNAINSEVQYAESL